MSEKNIECDENTEDTSPLQRRDFFKYSASHSLLSI